MKNTSRLTRNRIISFVMSIILFVTMIPSNAFATGVDEEVGSGTEEVAVSEENEELSLEETLQLEESLSEENAIPEESTESATVFDLGDGKKTIVYYGQDVRFEEEGELVDYDPALVTVDETKSDGGESLKKYKYVNKVGDSKHYIPDKLQEDCQILMEKDDYSIKMLPLDDRIQNRQVVLEKEETLTPYETIKEKRTIAVYEALDKSHAYEYTSLNQGIKESIILNEKPESNIFKFSLELKGLYAELNEEENTILLKEKSKSGTTDEVIAVVDRPFMNDASGEAYSEELTYSLEEIEDGYYLITLTVSKKYLNSAERIYPITIDPTMTWKGSETFLDVYVLNGSYADINFYDEDTRVMPVGIGSKGTYRTYFKLPNIKSKLADKYIDSAYLTVYETGKCDADQTIRINRITESWTTSTLTWNNKPSYYTVTYNNQFTTDGTQYQAHKISLTAAVRNFINSTNNPNYGFVMRNVTSDPEYAEFYGSRCAVATYRPKVVITYYDKPTMASSIYTTRLTNGSYVRSNYIKQGNRIYANWAGINSHNLSAVQYKFTGINGTAQPTSVSADAVDLTSYRSTGSATASGTNVGLSYSPSLPTGVYRLYIRGKDAAGMFGTARYMTVYVDGEAPTLTNVAVTPATTETSITSNCTPKVNWNASDTYFSKITVSVDGKTAKTVSTTAGNGSYTIPAGTISTSGVHTIRVRAYDKAGRYTGKTLNYYVDVDAPEITSLSVAPETSDAQASANLCPQVNWTINDSSLKKVELLLNGKSKYTTTDSSVTSYQFAQGALSESGKYTITLNATDSSGNVAEKEVHYYLDVDDPVFERLQITPVTSTLQPSGNKSPVITWEITDTALSSVSYSLDGMNYIDIGNSKTGSFRLPSSVWTAESGEFTIYVKAKDKAGNESTVSELTYYLGTSSDYIPKELGVTEYYGKHILSWQLDAYDAEKVAYDLHRGEEAAFTPNEDTLVEADIDAAKSIFIDKEILEKDTYYYKIVVRDLTENQNVSDGTSEEVVVENTVTKEQFSNTLGQKSYLSYLDVGLPMGNLSVEESSGNVIYSQSEFSISNAQLSYGLERTYNSLNERTSMFGTGWTDSWHKELYTDGTDIYFVDTDGSSYRFALNDGAYSCEETKEYELAVTETGYEILTKEDQLFIFNTEGQVIRISEPNGCEISYCYDGMGRLAYVISKEDKDGERKLTLVYDEDSYRLHSIEDFAGTVYQYDYAETDLVKVTIGPKADVASGISYHYSYGENGLLAGIQDGMSNLYSITYSYKKAASVDYPDGEKFAFTYSEGTTKVEKYTPNQTKIHEEIITYDVTTGKLESYTDAKGNVTSYEYVEESPYLVAKVKNVKAYQSINESQVVVFHETENVVETEYTYDENENVTEEISADGSVTTYTYDENEDVVAEKTIKEEEVLVDLTYEYDEQGNVIRTEDQIEDTVEMNAYDDGNLISTSVVNTNVQEIPEEMESTDDGNSEEAMETVAELAEEEAVATGSNAVSTASYKYDSQGNIVSEKTETGNVEMETQITYDSMGRVLTSVENGVKTVTEYDFLGRDIRTTIKEDNKADVVTTKTYHANSSLASERSTTGVTKNYTYDNRNRLLTTTTTGDDIETNIAHNTYGYEENLTIKNGVETVTEVMVYKEEVKDTAGTIISTTYNDVLGRTVKEVSGTTYTDYAYDVSGNCISSYEGSTESEEYLLSITLYDEEGRNFAEIIAPQVSDGIYVISEQSVAIYTEYDTFGNVSKETDALGTATTYKYDEEGKLTETDIAADGTDISVVYYTLTNGEELIQVTDANGNVKKELLNAAGLTAQTIDEGSESTDSICTSSTYDNLGRKTKDIFSDDTYITYSYDGESERVTEKEEYLKDGTRESSTTYTYNNQNQLIGILHKEGDTEVAAYTYTYDVSGRVLTESVSYDSETAKTTSYEYDAEGRLVKTVYPEESEIGTIDYEYDSYGKLLKIKKDHDLLREYVYDSFNRVTNIKDFDKAGSSSYTLKTYTYDGFGRTLSMVYTEDSDTSKVLESYSYAYDKKDNIVSETRISNLPSEDSRINETRDYVYDSYGRLVKSTITDHTADDTEAVTTYEYDVVGNRVKQTEDGAVTTYEYNGLNQLEKVESSMEELTYVYDARGNQLEENSTSGESVLTTYNIAGEMVELQKKSNGTVTFTQTNVYNQDGSRISRTQGETEREYYYNNGVLAFTEDNDTVSSSNIQNADGNVVGTYRGDTYYNYFKNLQGSTASIVSEIGGTAVVYTYSDFGETEEVVTDTIDNEICYTGAIYDKDTDLYYMNARYYDAETGRFISQDSYRGEIEDAETWHLYAYCANNPVNYVDPTGHAMDTILDVASIAVGVGDVIKNPKNPVAWLGLSADIVCACVPFLTGAGSAIRGVAKSDDVIDAAREIYRNANRASDIRKATGSYVIKFANGKVYVGKGGYSRAITSAKNYSRRSKIKSIEWKKASSHTQAFINEYKDMCKYGGLKGGKLYNKIWSPGRSKYYKKYKKYYKYGGKRY